jgi:hypothetical protein
MCRAAQEGGTHAVSIRRNKTRERRLGGGGGRAGKEGEGEVMIGLIAEGRRRGLWVVWEGAGRARAERVGFGWK